MRTVTYTFNEYPCPGCGTPVTTRLKQGGKRCKACATKQQKAKQAEWYLQKSGHGVAHEWKPRHGAASRMKTTERIDKIVQLARIRDTQGDQAAAAQAAEWFGADDPLAHTGNGMRDLTVGRHRWQRAGFRRR